MQITCNKCAHTMDGTQAFMSFCFGLGKLFGPMAVQEIFKLLKEKWFGSTRSCCDSTLAAFACTFNVECSHCKEKGYWSPFTEEVKPVQKEDKKQEEQAQV